MTLKEAIERLADYVNEAPGDDKAVGQQAALYLRLAFEQGYVKTKALAMGLGMLMGLRLLTEPECLGVLNDIEAHIVQDASSPALSTVAN